MNTPANNRWPQVGRYLAAGKFAAARVELESILAQDPGAAPAHLALGGICLAEDHPRSAAEHVLTAARTPPADPMLLGELIGALLKIGEMVAARRLLDDPAITSSSDARVLMRTARQRQALGEHQAALALIERAGDAGVQGPDYLLYRATERLFNGQLQEAEADLDQCVASGRAPSRAWLQLASIRTQTTERNHLGAIGQAIGRVEPQSEDHGFLEFARYKELEDLGRFDEAWTALERGNAMLRARLPRNHEDESVLFDRLIELCTPEFLRAEPMFGEEGPCPIFVVGIPRSGTTVLERILGNHSQVASAGELLDFPRALVRAVDHQPQGVLDQATLERLAGTDWAAVGRMYLEQTQWRAHGRAFYVDKMPRNWMLAGLIHKALPRARIINLVRDGVDLCFSNWRACFGTRPEYRYAYDLDSLAAHFMQYRRLMSHWHRALPGWILDVDYSRLVHDPEGTAREIFDHCGLAFEPNCSAIEGNRTPVATLSAPQVRQPVHTRSFRSWSPYATQLQGLISALAASAK